METAGGCNSRTLHYFFCTFASGTVPRLRVESAADWNGSGKNLRFLPDEIAAFGDAENDCDMIRYAGLGIAMGNGHPLLQEAADMVTVSNEEDGVALVIEQILKGSGQFFIS